MQRTRWTNGSHQMEFQDPDILIIHLTEIVTVEEVKEAVRIMKEEVAPAVGPLFYFIHFITGLKSIDLESRKYFPTINPPWRAVVLIGGTPTSRAAANVTLRAINLFSGRETPMRMVESFEEAYAYASEMRAKANASRG